VLQSLHTMVRRGSSGGFSGGYVLEGVMDLKRVKDLEVRVDKLTSLKKKCLSVKSRIENQQVSCCVHAWLCICVHWCVCALKNKCLAVEKMIENEQMHVYVHVCNDRKEQMHVYLHVCASHAQMYTRIPKKKHLLT
jgi:hypothetical protein